MPLKDMLHRHDLFNMDISESKDDWSRYSARPVVQVKN